MGNKLFFVAQLNDTFGNQTHSVVVELYTQSFQVFFDARFAGGFTQGILAYTAKTFGQQIVEIKVAFDVSIGVNARCLGKNIVADYRLVGRNAHAGIRFHNAAYSVDPVLPDAGLNFEQIVQHGNNTGNGSITCSFAQTVYRSVHGSYSCPDSLKNIGNGQIVIVVGMEIKFQSGVTFHHLPAVKGCLFRSEDTQGIGQHKMPNGFIAQAVHQVKDIVGRMHHAVGPVFEIEVHLHPLGSTQGYFVFDIL